MKTLIEQITPARAKDLLKLNLDNRKIQKMRVMTLAAAITRGEWQLTPQGIAIATDGRLLDGQHRLEAVCVANQSITIPVSYDCDPSIFKVLDVGKSRSYADALRINSNLAACTRVACYLINNENYSDKLQQQFTTQQMSETLDWFLPYYESLHNFCSVNKKNRTVSVVKVAVIARMIKHPESFTDIGEQYYNYTMLNYEKFWPGIGLLLKYFDNNKLAMSAAPGQILARAWLAFEPGNMSITKLHVTSIDIHLFEIKQCLLKASGKHILLNKTKKVKEKEPCTSNI